MKYNKHIISLSIALIFGSLIQTVHATPENLPVAVKKESPQARKAQQIKIDVAKSGIALQDQKAMRTILTSPNAQYIKVYFSAFSLPDGAYVELSHPVSGERYRYTNDTVRRDLQGLMPAMSVSGETVVLEIVDPSGSFDSAQHSVVIDQYHTTTQSVVMRAPPDATAEHVPNLRIRPACFNDDKDDLEKQAIYHYSRPIALVNNYNPNEQGYGSYGSAWRVGEPMKDENGGLRFLMFTNHHVFKDSHDDSKVEVWFDHEHINCKHDLRRPHLDRGKAPVKFAAKKKLRSNSGRDLDYQLFELQVSPEDVAKLKSFGYLGLDITTATEGQGIYIPQHGTDPNVGYENDEVVLKTIATITPDGESCKLDYVFETIEENIRYSCPTSGATSGSPVTNSDTHTVVGLHNGGYTPDDGSLKINFAAMMQYIWREVAPDFGSVVPVSYPIIDTVIDDSVEPEPIIDTVIDEIVGPEPIIDTVIDDSVEPEPIIDTVIDEIVGPEPIIDTVIDDSVEPEPIIDTVIDDSVEPEPIIDTVIDDNVEPEPIIDTVIDEIVGPEPVDVITPEDPVSAHPVYKDGGKYTLGDVVRHNGNQYQCKQTGWCGQSAYAPGSSYGEHAWTVYTNVENTSGYPTYQAGQRYDGGAIVFNQGALYQCQSGAVSGWCSQSAYAPGVGTAWSSAWHIYVH